MTIVLEQDQADVVERLRATMKRGVRSILLRGEVGSGKTVITSYIIKGATSKGYTAMMVAPRRQLVSQIGKTFAKFGINYSYVCAGYGYRADSQAWAASTETLYLQLDKVKVPDIVAIDETHYGHSHLDTIIKFYKSKGCWIIGLSATPWKMSGKGLGCWYDEMIEGPTMAELIEMGRLSDYKYFKPSTVDTSGIRKAMGDYSNKELSERFDNDRVLVGSVVDTYKQTCLGRLGVTFCVSIAASKNMAQAYRDAGIPAAHLDGTMNDKQIQAVIRAYANRDILNITNCDLLTFGFDLASASGVDVAVECMSDAQPTLSVAKQRQKIGRVMRRKDKPAIINDHVGNFEHHGFPDDDFQWTLEDIKRNVRAKSDEEVSVEHKHCPSCHFTHKPKPFCPNCGYEYPVQSRQLEEVEGVLEEADLSTVREQRKMLRMEIGKARSPRDKIQIERDRGYKKGWAYKQCVIKRMIPTGMDFGTFYKVYGNAS